MMIFSRLREFSGAEYDGVQEQWDLMPWHAKLVSCPYCISVWLALLLYLVSLVNKRLFIIAIMSLAGSGVTALIEDYGNG